MSGKLTPENTLNEFFEFFDREENAVQVVPVTIKQQEDDTRLAIFIHGKHEPSSVIMAELMSKIDELFDLQAQAEASREPESRIIT
jgi:hypothetical protein